MSEPLNLDEIRDKWLALCGGCDAGIGACTHPDADYRPVMLRLVEEIERLRSGQLTEEGT